MQPSRNPRCFGISLPPKRFETEISRSSYHHFSDLYKSASFPTKNGSPLATNLSPLNQVNPWRSDGKIKIVLLLGLSSFLILLLLSDHLWEAILDVASLVQITISFFAQPTPLTWTKPFKSQETSSEISQEMNFKNFCTKSSMNSAQLMETNKNTSPRSAMEIFSPSVHLWLLYSLYIWNDVAKNTKCTSLSSGNLWKFHELHQSSFWDVWFAGLPLHMLPFANQRSTEHPFSATWLCFLVPSLN